MARDGALEIDEADPDFVDVYFVPPRDSLLATDPNPKKAKQHRTRLMLDINSVALTTACAVKEAAQQAPRPNSEPPSS